MYYYISPVNCRKFKFLDETLHTDLSGLMVIFLLVYFTFNSVPYIYFGSCE